jgi:hypothetical protein
MRDQYIRKGHLKAERSLHAVLRTSEPGFALARSWAGHEAGIAALREQIAFLADLLHGAIEHLSEAGRAAESKRIEDALMGT